MLWTLSETFSWMIPMTQSGTSLAIKLLGLEIHDIRLSIDSIACFDIHSCWDYGKVSNFWIFKRFESNNTTLWRNATTESIGSNKHWADSVCIYLHQKNQIVTLNVTRTGTCNMYLDRLNVVSIKSLMPFLRMGQYQLMQPGQLELES